MTRIMECAGRKHYRVRQWTDRVFRVRRTRGGKASGPTTASTDRKQRRLQQLIAQMNVPQAAAAPFTQGTTCLIRTSDPPQDTSTSTSPSSSNFSPSIDPAEEPEAKKINLTPLVVQDNYQVQPRYRGPMLPSDWQ